MRRLGALTVAGVAVATSAGCTTTHLNDSPFRHEPVPEREEDVRQVGPMHPWQGEQDKPDARLTPVRIHGGIQ